MKHNTPQVRIINSIVVVNFPVFKTSSISLASYYCTGKVHTRYIQHTHLTFFAHLKKTFSCHSDLPVCYEVIRLNRNTVSRRWRMRTILYVFHAYVLDLEQDGGGFVPRAETGVSEGNGDQRRAGKTRLEQERYQGCTNEATRVRSFKRQARRGELSDFQFSKACLCGGT